MTGRPSSGAKRTPDKTCCVKSEVVSSLLLVMAVSLDADDEEVVDVIDEPIRTIFTNSSSTAAKGKSSCEMT